MLVVVRIITSKQKNFSVRSSPGRQLKKKCSPIQFWSGQNWLQSCPCSSLLSFSLLTFNWSELQQDRLRRLQLAY